MNRRTPRIAAAFASVAAICQPLAARAIDIGALKFLGKLSVPELIARVISGLLGLTGTLALAYFVYGGFTWMTAQGNDEKIKKAKNTIIWATLGLFLVFAAYSGVKIVLGFLE